MTAPWPTPTHPDHVDTARLAHVWRAYPFRPVAACHTGYYARGPVTIFLRRGEQFPRGMV